jgi:hypothetical protein
MTAVLPERAAQADDAPRGDGGGVLPPTTPPLASPPLQPSSPGRPQRKLAVLAIVGALLAGVAGGGAAAMALIAIAKAVIPGL